MKAVGQQPQKQTSRAAVGMASSGAAAGASGNRKRKMARSPPTTVELRGLDIHFPFQPYECQKEYMGKVLDALLRSENALLESPTGTGKTLCLLCATLAWQRNHATKLISDASNSLQLSQQQQQQQQSSDGNSLLNPTKPASKRVPTIVYASRTHSQLSQVVNELKNTRYRPKHAVLGSREQMCVHPKVKKATATSADINHDCNALAKERKCRYRNNLDGFQGTREGEYGTQVVLDMEDLVQLGKDHKVCPFYYTRSLLPDAELVLMPYNYLFDKDSRETTLKEIDWRDAVVIFDEAHNLESFATESASFDLTQTDIAICLAEITRAFNYVQMGGGGDEDGFPVKSDNLLRLKAAFLRFEDYITNLERSGAFSGEMMMDIFTKGIGINHGNHHLFIDECRKVNEMLLDVRGGGSGSTGKGAPKLEHFVQCVKRVFGESTEGRCLAKAKSYRVHITPKVSAAEQQKKQTGPGARNNSNAAASRTMSYWCFAPALAMQELDSLKIRSILVTSGTLSPLPSYSMELGLSFEHTLENPHIISQEQIHVRVIGKGVSGKQLTSSYQRRQDTDYYIELGNTLVSLAKVIPGGMLIFFPSYSVMETCLERWGGPASSASRYNNANKNNKFFAARKGRGTSSSQQFSFPFTAPSIYGSSFSSTGTTKMTPWKRLLVTKSVVVEPKSTADLHDAISEFHKYLDMPKSKGCALMGVCRGKISEGIDFANNMSRAVVITGLPFPPAFDPKVKLKREYLDAARASNSMKSKEEGGFGDSGAISNSQGISSSTSTGITQNTLSGHEWYSQQAHRAVNQAIGRVIRNRNDYGSILLLDSRFSQPINQQGLSKWVRPYMLPDEGFGVAISSLAKFYRQAEAKAKELEQVSKGLMLAYEEEEEEQERLKKIKHHRQLGDEEKAFTKVAFVQNFTRDLKQEKEDLKPIKNESEGEVSMKEDDCDADGPVSYIAPDRVIARMDAKAVAAKREPALEPIKKPESKGRSESVFDWSRGKEASKRPLATSGNEGTSNARRDVDTKPVAAQFLQRAKVVLSSADLASLKKSVIAMKQFGEKKEERSYLKAAQRVLNLCERHEDFFGERHQETLMFLFFRLIGKRYGRQVELMAMEALYKKSSLCQLCEVNLQPESQSKLLNIFPNFLRSLWVDNGESSERIGHDKTRFLKEAQKILGIIIEEAQNSVPSSTVEAFIELVPSRFASTTHALLAEMKARSNVRRLKATDAARKGGEDTLDAVHSQKQPPPKCRLSDDKVKLESFKDAPMPQKQLVKKEPLAAMRSEGTGKNPYTTKKKANVTNKYSRTSQGNATGSSVLAHSGRATQESTSSSSTRAVQPSRGKPNRTLSSLLGRTASTADRKDAANSREVPRTAGSKTTGLNDNRKAPAYSRHSSQLSKQSKCLPQERTTAKSGGSNGDVVATMLQEAESQPYVKRTSRDIVQNLKSNVPSHVTCMMCHGTAVDPLLGDCGHMACKSCWLQWLQKAPKCFVCRAEMKKESLARVIFQDGEQKKSDGPPTLSEL